MQTQSMTITVMYVDAFTVDYRSSLHDNLGNSCWSKKIWDLWNEE